MSIGRYILWQNNKKMVIMAVPLSASSSSQLTVPGSPVRWTTKRSSNSLSPDLRVSAAAVASAATSPLKRHRETEFAGSFESPPKRSRVVDPNSPKLPLTPRFSGQQNVQRATCAVLHTPARPLPPVPLFVDAMHGELQRARFGASSKLVCPPTPSPFTDRRTQKRIGQIPFIQNAQKIREAVAQIPFQPFKLTTQPGVQVWIDQIQHLSSQGQNSDVYLCEVRGMGQWVLKLFKPVFLDPRQRGKEVVGMVVNQLRSYAENKGHAVLRNHMAQHLNLDGHLQAISGILTNPRAMRDYVTQYVHDGFVLVKYIPQKFPVEFNQDDLAWQQLQNIYAHSFGKNGQPLLLTDLRRANVGIDENGNVVNFDPSEGELDDICLQESLKSFADKPSEREWLFPQTEFREDR